MKNSIILIISFLLFGAVASAQSQKVIEKEFEKFSTVKVQDNFVVKLVRSERYAVSITVDERIAAHVQAYEKSGVLNLVLDEKGYTKELKKALKQKGAAEPVLEVMVYMPEIKSLVLSDKVVVTHSDELRSENFALTVEDYAKVKQLKVSCATADLDISRNADVIADLNVASKLYLLAANSAKANINQNGGNAFLELEGSSSVDIKSAVQTFEVLASSGASSHISGTASVLTVNASGYSKTDAELLEVTEGQITQTGSSKCHVNVTERMKVNLTGGSMLTFKRMPIVEVDRIINSTLIKADDPKRK